MKKHKSLGQVYTPDWIVDEILENVGYEADRILSSTILEPSCGDGAFLKRIVSLFMHEAKKKKLSEKQIKQKIEKQIIAFEIDTEEYHKCIDNLNTLLANDFNFTSSINWNIINGDSLVLYKDYLGYFDFIVGNPPYIRIHNLDIKTRELIKNDFQFAEGTIDIYITFFELGFRCLKPTGRLSYITPNSYLHNSSYEKFREFIKLKKGLVSLTDFKANKIFKGFSTYTAISTFDFSSKCKHFSYSEFVDNKIHAVNKIEFSDLNRQDWTFSSKEDFKFLESLKNENFVKIGDVFNVQYGFATLRDGIFIGDITKHKDSKELVFFNDYLVEKKLLKKIVKGSTYKGNTDENKYIIFPYKLIRNKYVAYSEEELQSLFPKAFDYLLAHKEELEKRDMDKGAAWFEFGRSQGIQTVHTPKLVCSTLVKDKLQVYELPADVFVYSGIFISTKKDRKEINKLKSTLEAPEFTRYIRITGKDFSGGYKSITTKQIKNFAFGETKKHDLFS